MSAKTSKSRIDISTAKSIFAEAVADGLMSQPTKDLMCVSLDDAVLAGCAGVNPDDIEATEVTLVSLLIDDSGSMAGLEDAVIAGQRAMLEAFAKSKQKDSFLVGMWALNRTDPYHSYVKVDDAVRLDRRNYQPNGCTPLCDRWCEILSANVVYAGQLRANGTVVRSIVVVITDSYDNASQKFDIADCAKIAKDLLSSEQFILAMVGVGQETDFRAMAKKMAIPDGAVMIAQATASDMRHAFHLVSQSVIRASQAVVSPSKAQNQFFTS